MIDITRMQGLLTYYLSRPENTNNEAILRILKTEIDELQTQITLIANSLDVDQATQYMLDVHGSNVGESRLGRTDDIYKSAIKLKTAKNVSNGSIPTVKEILQTTLSTENVNITEMWENPNYLEPAGLVIEYFLSDDIAVIEDLNDIAAGGVRVESLTVMTDDTIILSDSIEQLDVLAPIVGTFKVGQQTILSKK